jgi:hypothetical protein
MMRCVESEGISSFSCQHGESSNISRVGNAHVTFLELHASIGCGVRLPSGGPYACLPPSLYKIN